MRYVLSIFVLFSFSYAIEVKLLQDSNITVDNDDVRAIRNFFVQKYNFHITDTRGAKKIVEENRILANQFLKEGLFQKNKKSIQIEIEDMLAKRYVKDLQNRTKISDKVAKSYYLDNIQKYKKPPKVSIVSYRFEDIDNAYRFYKESNTTSIDLLVKKYKPIKQMEIEKKEINALPKSIRDFIDPDKNSYTLPPFVISKGKVDVFYIKEYYPADGYIPFEDVKNQIKNSLHKQTFAKERKKILEKMAQ